MQIPKKFRFISNQHGREEYCKSLIKELPENINKWCDTDIEILNSLYGFSEKYKYISFHIYYEDYNLIILCLHNNIENEVKEGYKQFPQGGIAYGYMNFRGKYELVFSSYKDEGFLTLCDELLKSKNVSDHNWIEPTGFSQSKGTNFKIQLPPITEEILLDKMDLMFAYVYLFQRKDLEIKLGWREREELITFAKKPLYGNDDELLNRCTFNNTVKEYLVRIQLCMKNARTEEEQDNIKKQFELVAKNEQEIIEKAREEENQKNRILLVKEQLSQEMISSKPHVGKLTDEEIKDMEEHIIKIGNDGLTQEFTCIKEIVKEVVMKYGKGQMYQETVALASYIWAKRIYSMSHLCKTKYEERELSGYESNLDKAIRLSEYIAAFEKGEIVSYCAREVDDFVTIIVILFARSNKSMTILRKQIEIRDIEGIRNLSLESRVEELCMLHGISDEIEVLEDKQDEPIEYDVSKILFSSGAQWTAFFEEYGYDVMERAIYDVYEEVKKLFFEKGMLLRQLFEKRQFSKQYHLFSGMQHIECVGPLLSSSLSDRCFHRNGKKYIMPAQ